MRADFGFDGRRFARDVQAMPLPDQEALERRMKKLGIREDDLEEDFVRGSGPGGQKINKTSSTVVLRHRPSGLEVRCQRERSQVMNRHWARVELCEKMETARQEARLAAQNEREKIRRQTRPKPRGVKQKMLREKRSRGEVKRSRGRVRDE